VDVRAGAVFTCGNTSDKQVEMPDIGGKRL